MAKVRSSFFLGALGSLLLALLMRRMRHLVFHPAAELRDAGGRGVGVAGREFGGGAGVLFGVVMVAAVVVAAFGGDVGLAGDSEGTGDFLSRFGVEAVHVSVVVVRVAPD